MFPQINKKFIKQKSNFSGRILPEILDCKKNVQQSQFGLYIGQLPSSLEYKNIKDRQDMGNTRKKQYFKNPTFTKGKLIYQNHHDLRKSLTSKQFQYKNQDIKQVSKIISRKFMKKNGLVTQKKHHQLTLSSVSSHKYTVLEDEMNNLRKLMKKKRIPTQQYIQQKQRQSQIQIKLVDVEKQKKNVNNIMQSLKDKVDSLMMHETKYYQRIKYQIWNNNAKSMLVKNGYNIPSKKTNNNQGKDYQQYTIHFPQLKQLETLIQRYKPLTKDFNYEQLIQNGNRYSLDYNGAQKYLYFGQHNKRNQKQGKGVLITSQKILQGIWKKGEIVQGAELEKDYLYQGQFYQNKKHGKGKYQSVTGEEYYGSWINNRRHGFGENISQIGQTYVGQWIFDKAQGQGVFENNDGDKFTGNFKGFLKTGLGIEQFANGDFFQGQFLQGYPHGKGKYTWENGMYFQGKFINGLRQGYGFLKMDGLFEFNGIFHRQKPVQTENVLLVNNLKNHNKAKKCRKKQKILSLINKQYFSVEESVEPVQQIIFLTNQISLNQKPTKIIINNKSKDEDQYINIAKRFK